MMIFLRYPVGCGVSKSREENGREMLGQVVRPCNIDIVNLWANMYVNKAMGASCEPLDLILLPGMRSLASNILR